MSKIALSPNISGNGVFTLASPATNTDRTLTLPDAAGEIVVAGAIPVFSAGSNVVASVTNTSNTLITFNAVNFDSHSFWNTGSSVFTPTIPGYYWINASLQFSTVNYSIGVIVFKNGVAFKWLGNSGTPAAKTEGGCLMYLNGTDFIAIAGHSGTTQNTIADPLVTYVSAHLVRKA